MDLVVLDCLLIGIINKCPNVIKGLANVGTMLMLAQCSLGSSLSGRCLSPLPTGQT